jgi:hypothetical protein
MESRPQMEYKKLTIEYRVLLDPLFQRSIIPVMVFSEVHYVSLA